MLTVILVLQIVIILLIVVLAIIGHRKLNERRVEMLIEEAHNELAELNRKLNERRVEIECEPVIYYQDKFFSDKVVAGYRTQIFYDGIPVGEPTERIVYQANIVDREAVCAALELALQGLQTGLMKGFELGDIQAVINKILPK